MTYLIVMGSLTLSVLFTLGWALARLLRWAAAGFTFGGMSASKGKRKPAKRSGVTRKKSTVAKASAKSPKARAAKPARTKSADKKPREPWRITQRLAHWHSVTALALVATLLFLVARLAEHGMSFRPPHTAPDGFHALVAGLGWLSAGLILFALLHQLAVWRCRK